MSIRTRMEDLIGDDEVLLETPLQTRIGNLSRLIARLAKDAKIADGLLQGIAKIQARQENVEIQEAEEISYNDLSNPEQKMLDTIMKVVGSKDRNPGIHRGIHGLIFDLSPPAGGAGRMRKQDLQALIKVKGFRWVEYTSRGVSVGL